MSAIGRNLRGALLALGAFAVFSAHDVSVKALGGAYHVAQIVFFAALLGLPAVFVLLMRDPEPGTIWPRSPAIVFVRSGAVLVSALSAFFAFAEIPLAQAYAIFFSTPILVTLLAVPLLGEKVGIRRATAIAVGMAGVLIVLRPGQSEFGLGHLSALVAALSSALTAVLTRRIGTSERAVVVLLYPMLGNIAVLGAFMPFVYRPMEGGDFLLVTLVALGSVGGMVLIIAAYRAAEAVVVAPMQYSQIVWAVFYGALFFEESPDAITLVGAAVVMGSGIYILLREQKLHGAPVAPAAPASTAGVGLRPRR